MVDPHFVEASMLMDETERFAELGELFSAGCWWHEAGATIRRIADPVVRERAVRRHSAISEAITDQERAAAIRSRPAGLVQELRACGPERAKAV